jgi:prophage maintenance system killer protein
VVQHLTLAHLLAVAEGLRSEPDVTDYGAAVAAVARGHAEIMGQPCYPTPHAMAAAYLQSLVLVPVLERGNAAFASGCVRYFLVLNGLSPAASPADWAALVVDIAEHRTDVRGIAQRIRDWLR